MMAELKQRSLRTTEVSKMPDRFINGVQREHKGPFIIRIMDASYIEPQQDIEHKLSEAEAWRLLGALVKYLATLRER